MVKVSKGIYVTLLRLKVAYQVDKTYKAVAELRFLADKCWYRTILGARF